MTRTTILMDKLIILALHSRVEALIGGDVMAAGTAPVLRTTPGSTLLIIITAHVRWSLVTWPM